ncbi:MAG: hypothetical protein ACLQVN_04920 [Bryobacteraceae bacterium]
MDAPTRVKSRYTRLDRTSRSNRAKVYHDRLVLEKGAGVVKEVDSEVIEAETLRISPSAKNSVLQVEITGPSHVAVGALLGSAEVRNSSGALVASLRPGLDLAFDAQAGSSTSVTMTGVLIFKNGNYFLTDATTGVTVELVGTDLGKDVGKNVTITGSIIPDATPPGGIFRSSASRRHPLRSWRWRFRRRRWRGQRRRTFHWCNDWHRWRRGPRWNDHRSGCGRYL